MSETKNRNSISACIGVNSGYDGANFLVSDPLEAAAIVKSEIHSVGIEGEVFPGHVLYDMNRGCPKGGEVVGVVFTSSAPDLLKNFNKVRLNLHQSTLSVITEPDTGIMMNGVVADFGESDLTAVAESWQSLAEVFSAQSGFYVSAAVFAANGRIYGQAEANPTRISDPDAWQRDAKAIITGINPYSVYFFREVGYHYLRNEAVSATTQPA